MSISQLPPKYQALYIQFLKNKAQEEVKRSIKEIPIDPQDRVLIDISFSAEDLQKIKILDPSIDEKAWKNLIGQSTAVSLDIKEDQELKKEFDERLLTTLKK